MNPFTAAPFVGVDGALVGGVEIDEGVIAGAAAGEAWGGGDGGELMADGEGEGLLVTGTGEDATGELALVEGEIAGDGAWDGGVEIDDGVTAGAATGEAGAKAGEPKEAGGGDVGELTANGEGDGAFIKGTGEDTAGELAEGEPAGDDDRDRAKVELTNSEATSINTMV